MIHGQQNVKFKSHFVILKGKGIEKQLFPKLALVTATLLASKCATRG
jgi:hypothetical protein